MNKLVAFVGLGAAITAVWLMRSPETKTSRAPAAGSEPAASAVVRPNREAAQTDRELANVRANMARLERRLEELANDQATEVSPSPPNDEGKTMLANAQLSLEAERTRAERIKLAMRQNMSEAFAAQPVDAARNWEFREQVGTALAQDNARAYSLDTVECRSLSCRIKVLATNPDGDNSPAADLLRGQAFGAMYYHPGDRAGETILYVFRPDAKEQVRELLSQVQQQAAAAVEL